MDYRWWVFVHLTGVFGFLLAHGVSVTVLFRLRKERDRDRIRELISLSGSTILWFYASLAVLLAGGIGAGLKQSWFKQRWIWISIYVLVGVSAVMFGMARPYYKRISEALALRPSGAPRVSDEDLATRLVSPVPVWTAGLGFGGLLAILWLMIFKPA